MSDTGHTEREEPAAWRKRVGRSDRHDPDVWKWSEWTDGKWPDDYEDREFVRYESQPLYTRASPSLPILVEALEQIQRDCQSTIDLYERNGPAFTSPAGDEYEPTSFVIEKMGELISRARAALTSIKGGDVPARVTIEEISE